ncbi:hypothetical protein NP233_g2669 [Leucocoprinus birnbaumii]|uniref:Extracellular membrane protein CFEM domain-containing protein n=1 Tax=Leucocoprinus birnbaumii TaxID=56174 RepID=A0AAD5VZX8_9AGAR|nr:hypothetical protein NP233_g2669 [Leucocoprinus birnbaumii]
MVAYRTVLVTLLSAIAASASTNNLDWDVRSLVARQSSGALSGLTDQLPEQCKSTCTSVINAESSCGTSLPCFCTDKLSSSMADCLQCAINVAGQQSAVSQIQSGYDAFASACNSIDSPIKNVTFSLNSGAGATLSQSAHILSAGMVGGVSILLQFLA